MGGNPIKYGSTTKNVVLKSNNFNVGSFEIDDYGPTSVSGFYAGIEPPVGGYTIYVNLIRQHRVHPYTLH